MNILEKLFGSAARVKVLRLFLLSPDKVFTAKEAARLLKISKTVSSKEIKLSESIGFLKTGSRIDEVLKKLKTKNKIRKRRVSGFILSQTFPFLLALRNLIVNASPVSREKMLKFFKNKGRIKLLAFGGIFSENSSESSARLDLLIVGELQRGTVERFIKKLEAEIGKELNWTLLSSLEFDHRIAMHDRLLRDLFDYPHEFLINKLGVE